MRQLRRCQRALPLMLPCCQPRHDFRYCLHARAAATRCQMMLMLATSDADAAATCLAADAFALPPMPPLIDALFRR